MKSRLDRPVRLPVLLWPICAGRPVEVRPDWAALGRANSSKQVRAPSGPKSGRSGHPDGGERCTPSRLGVLGYLPYSKEALRWAASL